MAGHRGRRRIERETQDLEKLPLDFCQVTPSVGDQMRLWRIDMNGPPNTSYEGGIFEIELKFGNDYPERAPQFRMKTKIWHINVSVEGIVCLEKLSDQWKRTYTVREMLEDIYDVLKEPSIGDAINEEALDIFAVSRDQYYERATQTTEEHAMGKKQNDKGQDKDDSKDNDNDNSNNNNNNNNGDNNGDNNGNEVTNDADTDEKTDV